MNAHDEVALWHALYQLETRYWHEVDANGGRNALTREWAVELAKYGIRVNAVIVAECWTPLYAKWLHSFPNPEEARRHIESRIPCSKRGQHSRTPSSPARDRACNPSTICSRVPISGKPPHPARNASCSAFIRSGGMARALISSENVSIMFLAASQSPFSCT